MSTEEDVCACPFCDGGEVPMEVIERIRAAAAGPMSGAMNLAEFRTWLYALEPAVDPAA